MKTRLIISVLFATFAQDAFGRRQDQNYHGFQSREDADYSKLEELYKGGVRGYWKATGIIFTDAERLIPCKNLRNQQGADCSNDTFESSEARLAATIRMILNYSLAAILMVLRGAGSAIDAARTVGYGQAEQLSEAFYGALLTACGGNTPANRLKLEGIKNMSFSGVVAWQKNLFAPILSDESISDRTKAAALIYQVRATTQMVMAVQDYVDALYFLMNAASNGTETARKTACSKIRIFRKKVFRRVKAEHGIRFAFLEALYSQRISQ